MTNISFGEVVFVSVKPILRILILLALGAYAAVKVRKEAEIMTSFWYVISTGLSRSVVHNGCGQFSYLSVSPAADPSAPLLSLRVCSGGIVAISTTTMQMNLPNLKILMYGHLFSWVT